jgi:flagellar biosynthesis protein FliQ
MIATLSRKLVTTVLERWELDRRIAREGRPEAKVEAKPAAEEETRPGVSRTIGNTSYWLILLLFVPAILDSLGIQGLLAPVQSMVDKVLAFLPNLASAALILAVGWFVARVMQHLVSSLASGVGADRVSERVGLSRALGKVSLSSLLGVVVYALILIPVAIGALNALRLEAITAPASEMLQTFFDAVPLLFAAVVVVGIAYVAARLLGGLATRLLQDLGFDGVLSRMGLAARAPTRWTPSRIVGGLVMLGIMLFAIVESAGLLGFTAISELGSELMVLGGHILLGLVIFGLGMFLADLAARAVRGSGVTQARVLSVVTRVAVLALAGAMALRQMGIADEIIELAFGLVLGSAAVAAALAFGLGGREAAGRLIEDMRSRWQPHKTVPPAGGGESHEAAE